MTTPQKVVLLLALAGLVLAAVLALAPVGMPGRPRYSCGNAFTGAAERFGRFCEGPLGTRRAVAGGVAVGAVLLGAVGLVLFREPPRKTS